MTGKLFVIAGPTAVGKGTVVNFIRQLESNLHLSISATTRAPRPGEVDGQSYFFISHEKFDQLISEDQMLEYAVVHGVNK